MQRRRSPLAVIIMILVIVVIAGFAYVLYSRKSETKDEMDKMNYYGLESDGQAALVVDDRILDAKGLVRDGNIYIDYPTVTKTFNSGFYWETSTEQLLLALPEGTLSWTVSDGEELIREGDTLYISAECVQENSDIDMTILEDPHRVVARTSWDNLAAETVLEDDEIRYRGGPKSEILTYVKAGDTVVLVENADSWCKVSTQDGYLGYIKKEELQKAPEDAITHTTGERFLFSHILMDEKVVLSWQYVDSEDDNGNFASLTENVTGLNVISPTWFSLENEEGDMLSFADAEYVSAAHSKGIKVWPALTDVVFNEVTVGNALATYPVRSHIVEQLMAEADKAGFDGINLDLEKITEEMAPQYLQFLKELCIAAHAKDLIVSVDNYVPVYTAHYNRAEQAKTVDYLIIMGYDEHTGNSSEAGSVASLPFVEQGITETLEEVDPSQVINAIPFYTRAWTSKFGEEKPSCETKGMTGADDFVELHNIPMTWDSTLGQSVGSIEDEEARYSIWLEDERAVEEKMKLVQKYDLAGVGAWRLGFERSTVWDIIQKYL